MSSADGRWVTMEIKDIDDHNQTCNRVLLHLHCLLFGVLGWVSVQHFEISADVRRAI